jgi:hypothetical protein
MSISRIGTVALAIGTSALLAACGGGGGGSGAAVVPTGDPLPNESPDCQQSFDSTFGAIQAVIFEGHGCATDTCHGSAASGGLDLRAGHSYANLLEVRSQSSGSPRIQPGEPGESFLYRKVLAAAQPGSVAIAGSPMPIGLAPLSDDELEALRLWIEAGAPEEGSIGDSIDGTSDHIADLLGACLPDATPITIKPLDPPPPGEGVQFVMPPYVLPAGKEREVCVAQYYDFSDQVPARYKDPSGAFMYVNGSRLRQDPHSHHLVIDHSGLDAGWVHDPSFGSWTCKGGARNGEECEPTDLGSCGDGLCASEVRDSTACIGFGPVEGAINVAGGGLGGAQTAQQYEPPREGVYRRLPIRGILYYNSHAFNLTGEDHLLNARMNFFFADDLQHEVQSLIDIHAIYTQAGQAPFTEERYCAESVLKQGTVLLSLSSHTHKRGRHFTVAHPDGTQIYESFEYSDPVDQNYDPPLRFDSPDPAERRLRYCASFNNGVKDDGSPEPRLATKLSTMPDRTTCRPVACATGLVGAPCTGAADDATCDSSPGAGDGTCDACKITAGATTENEMFVLTGFYYVDPR